VSHPVKLRVRDDLARRRWTVFLRLLLALPHIVWVALWGIVAFLAGLANGVATLVRGTSPAPLHRFLAAYVRYTTHVTAYLSLLAEPYPSFVGRPGYAVDVELAPPAPQNRWTVAFRIVLMLPAALMAGALAGGLSGGSGASTAGGLLSSVAFLGWFAALVRGRMPRGLRDAGAYGLAYSAQLGAYALVLTDRYPNSDPQAALEDLPPLEHPVRLEVDDDLRRSRLTVFFRLLLALPHLVWLQLWGIAALFALVASWFATLARGTTPAALHRFLSSYVRYQTHVYAFAALTANPFPGFTGRAGSYPVDLVVAERARQNRWTVGFRLVLAIPALLLAGAYGGVLLVAALLGWFAALARGRMPLGLRNAGALALRYTAQTYAYVLLLTDRYPYGGPTAAA